jgi:CelD/BcsL family acetyltransferase involved in cellulose biosynthesis
VSKVAVLSHEEMKAIWRDPRSGLRWNCLFMLPVWIKAWWDVFGEGEPLRLLVSGTNGAPLGIAPLKRQGQTASFLGSADVCDYQDVIVAPARETDFSKFLFDDLQDRGVTRLELNSVRPDAAAVRLAAAAQNAGFAVQREAEDLSVIVTLPHSWEDYLYRLNGKQRHEIRRKLRRLREAGGVSYCVKESRTGIKEALPAFLHLFKTSRSDKAAFMTARMQRFFKALVESLSGENIIKLYFLELEGRPTAAAFCFEYESTTYLYNSGYDPRYRSLSVGLMSKTFSLNDSIQRGKRQFDLLKGGEPYKFRLGGNPMPLYRYRIDLQEVNR